MILRSTASGLMMLRVLSILRSLLFSQVLFKDVTNFSGVLADGDSHRLQGLNLFLGRSSSLRNDGPGMAHSFSRRCCDTCNKGGHRLGHMRSNVFGGMLFGLPTDLMVR